MLAVQQRQPHRMGSSQPPSDDPSLFGYDFNRPNPEPLPEAAPEPPPGDPLLSETDSRLLSSFFDDITADQYNMPSFGEGLNFSNAWFDLPPQFMGSSTFLGNQPDVPGVSPPALAGQQQHQQQQQQQHHHLQRQAAMSNMMPPPPPPPQQLLQQSQRHGGHQQQASHQYQHQQQHSEDVLHAAATLLRNGAAASRSDPAQDGGSSRRNMVPPIGHLRHQPMDEFKQDARRANMVEFPDDNTFVDWMGTAGSQPQRSHSRPVAIPEFQWGSDSNFGHAQAYTPGVQKDSVESHQRTQLGVLDCLEPSQSADNTRPNSPGASEAKPAVTKGSTSSGGLKPPEDPDAPPRKRRKSKVVKSEPGVEDSEVGEETTATKPARRRKPKTESSYASSPPTGSDAGGKRRKPSAASASSASNAKAARENLTEEQKRENHIRSEQKRRTLIKEGFDDLCELIPGLSSRGLSKSTMLSMAGEYLEQLLDGNKELKEQLAGMGGRR